MTQSIREAAQALIDIVMQQCGGYTNGPGFEAAEKARSLRAALSAPQPTADERIAEHMRLVREHAYVEWESGVMMGKGYFSISPKRTPAYESVKESARALLSESQEDAEHAAMYRWLREQIKDEASRVAAQALLWNHNSRMELDAAIRAAMKETR